jgi:uncharacterized RDD family membrane protein YckC
MSDRAIAAILDIIVMSTVFPVVGMWAAVRWGGVTSNGFNLEGAPGLLVVTIVGAVGFLYLWFGEGLFGATLGKAIMRLRVRNLAGSTPGLGKSLIRNLFRAIDGIGVYLVGFIVAMTSRTRQRLGDRVAGTVVVQVEASLASRLSAAIALVVLIVASILVAVSLHAGAPLSAASVPHLTSTALGTDYTPTYDIVGPTDTFPGNQPKIICVWRAEGVASDVPIRAVWIAEDVGSAAPPNTKLVERSITGADSGEFSLTPSSNGLPAGKYHVDIYIGDTLAKSLPFTITKS